MKLFLSLLLGTTLAGSAFASESIQNCNCANCKCNTESNCGCFSASNDNLSPPKTHENTIEASQTLANCGKCGGKKCGCR